MTTYRRCDAVCSLPDHRSLCDAATEHRRHGVYEGRLAAPYWPNQQQPEDVY